MRRAWLILLVGLCCLPMAWAGEESDGDAASKDPTSWFTQEHATAKLLILGTFHFKDAGLDSYKPQVDVDIMSEARQQELEGVLKALQEFGPTKILIEVKAERAQVIHERYRQFLAGDFELAANEIYQIGFKLAKRLGHEQLFAVDVMGRSYENLPDTEAYAKEHGQSSPQADVWDGRLTELYQYDDHLKARQTLREYLLYLNSEERLRIGHGHYVLSNLALGTAEEFPAADGLTGWWYNRNLRIYSNVLRVMEKGDRLLLLIGAGHVPIIRHAADASPEIDLIDVSEILR